MDQSMQARLGVRLRQARLRAGIRQDDLARSAGVSTTALSRLESGAGSSVKTLTEVCEVLGINVLDAFPTDHGRRHRTHRLPGSRLESARIEERRSHELHREAIRRLRIDPERVIATAERNLAQMRTRPRNPLAEEWLAEWADALRTGPDAIEHVALRADERGNDLRQVSPFAGVLTESERRRALSRAA